MFDKHIAGEFMAKRIDNLYIIERMPENTQCVRSERFTSHVADFFFCFFLPSYLGYMNRTHDITKHVYVSPQHVDQTVPCSQSQQQHSERNINPTS